MSNITKPILLDETGVRMADALEAIANGETGGLPDGGTTGQVLAKASGTDYDVEWVDQSGGGTDIINDTAGAGDTDKAWSADKLTTEFGSISNSIDGMRTAASGDVGKALSPKTVVNNEVTEWKFVSVGGGGGGSDIDDEAGEGDTDKAWSANKLVDKFGDVQNDINGLYSGNILDLYTPIIGKYYDETGEHIYESYKYYVLPCVKGTTYSVEIWCRYIVIKQGETIVQSDVTDNRKTSFTAEYDGTLYITFPYNAQNPTKNYLYPDTTDKTLLKSGKAADAGVSGARISALETKVHNIGPEDIIAHIVGRNLFNKWKATAKYYIDPSTGIPTSNNSYFMSDYIPVEPDTRYGANNNHYAWYTENKEYISGGDTLNGNSPVNAKYLRVDGVNSKLDTLIVCKGISRGQYDKEMPYEVSFPWLKVDPQIDAFKLNKYGATVVNMFNKHTCVEGQYVDHTTGTFTVSSTYFRSDYIPVEPNTVYKMSHGNRYAVYDSNYQYIEGANLSGDPKTFTTPANAAYVAVCGTPVSRKEIYILAKSADYPATYESYGIVVPWIKPSVPKSKYDGKTLVCFGDSITHLGYTGIIKGDTGLNAINQGYSSARYAYASDAGQYVNAFSLHNLIDAIVTGDWTIPDTIIGQSDYSAQQTKLATLKTIDFNNVDFVSFAYGTNDFSSGTTFDNQSDLYDTNYFKGAIRYSIKTLLTEYPHLKIIGATPIYRFAVSGGVVTYECDDLIIDGNKLADYVTAVKEAFADMKLPCVDNLTQAGINPINKLNYFDISDPIHPNVNGLAMIGHRIGAAILKEY